MSGFFIGIGETFSSKKAIVITWNSPKTRNFTSIPFGMREKIPLFEVLVSPVLAQNLDIWNSRGSLALDNDALV